MNNEVSLTVTDINNYIDEMEAENFLETEKVNNENKSSITNIYKAFYGG